MNNQQNDQITKPIKQYSYILNQTIVLTVALHFFSPSFEREKERILVATISLGNKGSQCHTWNLIISSLINSDGRIWKRKKETRKREREREKKQGDEIDYTE